MTVNTLPFGPSTARDVTPKNLAETVYTITRQIRNYAYPRNGNTHNPTPNYIWFVRKDGAIVDGPFWSSKDAHESAQSLRDGSL